jgi:hypothetical protein
MHSVLLSIICLAMHGAHCTLLLEVSFTNHRLRLGVVDKERTHLPKGIEL